jgi:cell division protein FtsI/penicillin-binding protein 2
VAALAGGRLNANTLELCPGTKTVDGRVFVNDNRFDLGTVPLRTAFAMSCNTTFMRLGLALPPTALGAAARELRLGAPWRLPVESFSGSVPPPVGLTEQAADSIGQGRVLVSPLAMAEVAGAVQSGRPVAPSLVVGDQAQHGPPLPQRSAATLRELMRATVTGGRRDHAHLPGRTALIGYWLRRRPSRSRARANRASNSRCDASCSQLTTSSE